MQRNLKTIIIPLLLLCTLLTLAICRKYYPADSFSKPIEKTSFLLGTIIQIKIYDKSDMEIIDKAFERISEIERKMTINNAQTSEIIKLNEASGIKEVAVSSDTFYVLQKGKYYSELSKGKFDITVGPLVKLWNIGTEQAKVPEQLQIDKILSLIDYNKLKLNEKNTSAMLEALGMKVDLGAIAKGYAADEVYRILKENGVQHAIINLGGNLLAIGNNPSGAPWKLGIQNPSGTQGDYMGIVKVTDKTIVTSGTYERYFVQDNKKYHHILDTKTGYPIENELVSVTIITDKSIDADGLSTAAFAMGLEEGINFVEKLNNVEAVFITNENKVYITSGLKSSFEIVNKDFILQ